MIGSQVQVKKEIFKNLEPFISTLNMEKSYLKSIYMV